MRAWCSILAAVASTMLVSAVPVRAADTFPWLLYTSHDGSTWNLVGLAKDKAACEYTAHNAVIPENVSPAVAALCLEYRPGYTLGFYDSKGKYTQVRH